MAQSMNDQLRDYAGLVESLARKLSAGPHAARVGAEYDDLAQEGYIAIWQALARGVTPSAEIIEDRMRNWFRYLARQSPIPYEALLPLDDYPSAGQRFSYTEGEVSTLITEYAGLKAKVDTTRPGLRYLVMLADLSRALDRLPRKYWEVVLLHGLLGLNTAQAAKYLHISHQAVSKRYRHALDEVHYLMNGGQ